MPVLSTVAAACARAWGFTAGDLFAGAALALDFDETTTLDSRITFTRATNGTYFDSSGVLQTASSGAARFDHRLESSVWVNKGLLIEEQRTNTHLYSEAFNSWANNNNVTVTADDTTAPDGNTTADAIFETAATGGHNVRNGSQTGLGTTTNYSWSVFAKANGRSIIALDIENPSGSCISQFDLSSLTTTASASGTGVLVGATIQDVGNGWYRCVLSGRTGQTTASCRVYLLESAGTYSYTGDITKGVYLWGAQFEAGAFATSYIKTTTASVTRNADVASMTSTNFSDWYNATEGTVFMQNDFIGLNPTVGNRYWEISDNTANERFFLTVGSTLSPAFASRYGVIDGGATQAVIDTSFAAVANTTYKSIVVYKQNDFVMTIDGTQIGTDTSGTIPTVNRIDLGAIFASSASLAYMNGHIAKFYYWNTRKSNSFLQNITS